MIFDSSLGVREAFWEPGKEKEKGRTGPAGEWGGGTRTDRLVEGQSTELQREGRKSREERSGAGEAVVETGSLGPQSEAPRRAARRDPRGGCRERGGPHRQEERGPRREDKRPRQKCDWERLGRKGREGRLGVGVAAAGSWRKRRPLP